MKVKIIFIIIGLIGPLLSVYLALSTHKPRYYFGLILIVFLSTFVKDIGLFLDEAIHEHPPKKVKELFPKDLDFFAHRIVRFNSGTKFSFDDDTIKSDIQLTQIYQKNDKFYITFVFEVKDKENNMEWLDQSGEVELAAGNMVVGKTDRLNFYFYVKKTFLGNAELDIGIKKIQRGVVFQNFTIKGNTFNFK